MQRCENANWRTLAITVGLATVSTFEVMSSSATDVDSKTLEDFLKGAYVSGCVARGVERGTESERGLRYCNCLWEVLATNVTIREYADLERSNGALNSPVMLRIKSKLDACKLGPH